MKKVLKIAGIVAGTIAGLVIVLFIVLKLISDDQYKDWITGAVGSATGRQFSIGNLELDFGSSVSVKAEDISLANAEWAKQPEMVTVDRMEAELRLLPLFNGIADVRGLIDKTVVLVQTSAEGKSNWDIGSGEPAPVEPTEEVNGGGLPIRPFIREFRIQDLDLSVVDGASGTSKNANIDTFLVESKENVELMLSGEYQEKPIDLSGNLGHVDELMDNLSTVLSLSGNIGGSSLSASGNWGPFLPDLVTDLQLELDAPSVSEISAIAGYELADLGGAVLTAKFLSGDGRYSIRDIDSNLDGGLTTASVQGSLGSLAPLEGLEFQVSVSTADLNGLVQQFGLELPTALPPSVQVNARVAGNLGELGVKDIKAEIKDDGLMATLSGSVGHALAAEGVDLTITANADSISDLSKYAGMELPDLGGLDVSAQIASADEVFRLEGLEAKLSGGEVNVQVGGGMADLIGVAGIDAKVKAEIASLSGATINALEVFLKQFDVNIPLNLLPASAVVSARIAGNLKQLGMSDLAAEVRDQGVAVSLSGSVANVLAPQGVDATLTAKADSISDLSKYAGMELPDLGGLDVSAQIASADEAFRLEGLEAKLSGGEVNVQVGGGVADLIGVAGIDAKVKAEIASLSGATINALEVFLKQFDVNIPLNLLPASAVVSARIAGNLKQLGMSDLAAEVRDQGVAVSLSGSVANVLAPQGVDATLTAKADSISDLSKYAGMELPDLASLDVNGRVVSAGESYRLGKLVAKLEGEGLKLQLEGGVGDLLAMKDINAELKAGITSLAVLSALANTELPDTDPVDVHAILSSSQGDQGAETPFQITAATGGAKASVEGDLRDLKSVDNIEVAIAITASALSDFSKLAQRELPEQGPFSLTGTVKTLSNEYRLDDFKLTIDQQQAGGSVAMKTAGGDKGKIEIEGQLAIPYLDLSPLVTPALAPAEQPAVSAERVEAEPKKDAEPESEVETAEQETSELADRLFSTDPFSLDLLHQYNADVSVTAERLILGKTDIADLQIVLTLKDGRLAVEPIKSLVGKGTLDGFIRLDAGAEPAALSMLIDIKGAPMPRLGGALDLGVQLEGAGGSPAEFMGGLNGEILIVMTDSRLENSFITSFGSALIGSINPLAKEEAFTMLECGILRVEIKDGMAVSDEQFAMQMTKTTWRGGGEINLKTEGLEIGIAPKPRKGFGISVGDMASLVHVGGTLSDPKIQLDPKDVVMKYGQYGAAVSTGGLSLLLRGLLDKSRANVDVCAEISEGAVFKDAENANEEDESKE